MTRRAKIILLSMVGGVLALSIIAFLVLLVSFGRNGDQNNEDAALAWAEAAVKADDPPRAVGLFRRLVSLNPFKEEYRQKYVHALIRMRDYDRLTFFTNNTPCTIVLTADEKRIEDSLARGWALEAAGSNEQAAVVFESATNLNYFAVTPFLIDCHMRRRRPDQALEASLQYLRRFHDPRLMVQTAEWAALAHRLDLIAAVRDLSAQLLDRSGILVGYYCDALQAWAENRNLELVPLMKAVGKEIRTPLSRVLALEVACEGDDSWVVETCFREATAPAGLFSQDFARRSRRAVKYYLANHFPDKLPIAQMGRLADLISDEREPDVDLCRVSLLAKASEGILTAHEVEQSVKRFPKDRGIALIRETYERSVRR